jgi:hypothetical protein
MAKVTNYSTLVSACKDAAENDSTEFSNYIDTAIGLTENRLNRETDVIDTVKVTAFTVSSGNKLISKPTDYRVPHGLVVITSAGRVPVTKKTKSYIDDYWPVSASTGSVKYYGDYNKTQFVLAGTPVSTYSAELTYDGDVSPLTSANPVNVFTSAAPDALFYGCMAELAAFQKDFRQVDYWENKYKASILSLNNQGRRQRRDDEENPSSTASGYNTLQDGSK